MNYVHIFGNKIIIGNFGGSQSSIPKETYARIYSHFDVARKLSIGKCQWTRDAMVFIGARSLMHIERQQYWILARLIYCMTANQIILDSL